MIIIIVMLAMESASIVEQIFMLLTFCYCIVTKTPIQDVDMELVYITQLVFNSKLVYTYSGVWQR